MFIVAQDSESFTAFLCLDKDGVEYEPAALRYRVDDLTNGVEILGWTALTPAASGTITVTAAQNAMHNPARLREWRRVTIETTAPGGAKRYDHSEYELVRGSRG